MGINPSSFLWYFFYIKKTKIFIYPWKLRGKNAFSLVRDIAFTKPPMGQNALPRNVSQPTHYIYMWYDLIIKQNLSWNNVHIQRDLPPENEHVIYLSNCKRLHSSFLRYEFYKYPPRYAKYLKLQSFLSPLWNHVWTRTR